MPEKAIKSCLKLYGKYHNQLPTKQQVPLESKIESDPRRLGPLGKTLQRRLAWIWALRRVSHRRNEWMEHSGKGLVQARIQRGHGTQPGEQ